MKKKQSYGCEYGRLCVGQHGRCATELGGIRRGVVESVDCGRARGIYGRGASENVHGCRAVGKNQGVACLGEGDSLHTTQISYSAFSCVFHCAAPYLRIHPSALGRGVPALRPPDTSNFIDLSVSSYSTGSTLLSFIASSVPSTSTLMPNSFRNNSLKLVPSLR